MTEPVVKMACHGGRVTALGIDHGGQYLGTISFTSYLKPTSRAPQFLVELMLW